MSNKSNKVAEVEIRCPECDELITLDILFGIENNDDGTQNYLHGVNDANLWLHYWTCK